MTTTTTTDTMTTDTMTTTDTTTDIPATRARGSYADQILSGDGPQIPATRFAFHDFLRKEYRFGLDPSRKTCPLFVQGHCPLGNACPDKHAVSSTFNNLVCKHWLRSLCKKGEGCEFLHEYNLRKMPECNFFVRNGYCSNGEECLYLHIDPDSKLPKCPHYENGFCPLGPNCSKKHVRKPMICKFFLAGFCPDGSKECKDGGVHPKWTPPAQLPQPSLKRLREESVGEEKERWEEKKFGAGGGFGGGRRRFFGRGR